jgi:hypothetical protein
MPAISGDSRRTSDQGRPFQAVACLTAWKGRSACRRARRRRGLAPLEFTLSLPLLLFTMALMVALGAAATWKVRTLVASRNTAWRHRWPRGGLYEALRPPGWPSPGSYTFRGAGNLTAIDHPAFTHPVARGPMPEVNVDDRLFDPTRGLIEGEARHQRLPPMLARLGAYQHDVDHLLLDDKFQFAQMRIPANNWRRIPRIYVLDGVPAGSLDADPHTWQVEPGLFGMYWSAKNATQSRYNQNDLWILDRDPELIAWRRGSEFHPTFPWFCSTDPVQVRMDHMSRHQDRVYGWNDPSARSRRFDVPLHLCSGFIGLYRYQLSVLYPPPLVPPANHPNYDKIRKLQALQQQLQQPP